MRRRSLALAAVGVTTARIEVELRVRVDDGFARECRVTTFTSSDDTSAPAPPRVTTIESRRMR